MHYVVYGAGAVGGVIGARLHRAGHRTTLVARGAHLEAIRERGLTLESRAGREVVPVPAAAGSVEVEWSDDTVVLLCVKSHQTAGALDDLVAHAPPATPVVTAQNGVANEAAALRRFPRVYGMCVMQPCAHLEPGLVVQQSDPVPGVLDLGRFPAGADGLAGRIAADLRSAGFASEARADIMAWKHRKLIMNLANGVLACFRPGPERDELQQRAQAEGEAVLATAGIPVVSAAEDVERRGDLLRVTTRDDYGGSTWQSLRRGMPAVETDWLNGEIVLLARTYGAPAPVNELVQRTTSAHARARREPQSLDAATALAGLALLADRPEPTGRRSGQS